MCIYSPMPLTLSYCALIGKCALIRSNTVVCLSEVVVLILYLLKFIHNSIIYYIPKKFPIHFALE